MQFYTTLVECISLEYSNTAPLKLFQPSITWDFTKDFESKTNIKFRITNFSVKETRDKVIGGLSGLSVSNKTLCCNVSSDAAGIN